MNITTFKELEKECLLSNRTIYEITAQEQAQSSDISVGEVRKTVLNIINTMKDTIKSGMSSNEKSISGWCGDDCEKLLNRYTIHSALFGKLFQKIVIYALATSEENIRMGRITACPTAGSCGIVPAVLIAYSEEYDVSIDEQVNFLITAGKIGSIISNKVQLAGAVAGCQAECGVAAAMCAGGLAQVMGGSVKEILNASTLAIKNLLGLTCDPVCGLVEVPCIKRNPILAIHAVCTAELAMAGICSKIPPDEVIDAMRQTGQLMSPLLKESAQAGLAVTKTALELKTKIFKRL
ncbi:MAG: L-serine ammonia-lyase, iron-sulfur-dependent, subunit alpha [Candidatus Gastranaerophilales bacterium]|nr:L-serine ammonia-lyase, iron-sulfur-dependent, subunit alpha [Candidatus Gastranaerophilales bacterium]